MKKTVSHTLQKHVKIYCESTDNWNIWALIKIKVTLINTEKTLLV